VLTEKNSLKNMCRFLLTCFKVCMSEISDKSGKLLLNYSSLFWGPSFHSHLILTTHKAAWYIILVVSLCRYVCQTITFECLDIGISYFHIQYVSKEYGSSSYMKVIGSRSRSRELKTSKSLIPAM